MSMVMLIGVILIGASLGWGAITLKGLPFLRSSRPGHPFRCLIALVPTVPKPLLMLPMYPRLPRRMQPCEKMISMGISDMYGSIPEGFS